jgi:GxxExxY protein
VDTNDITAKIIEAAIRVHKELGPGLLESVYTACLTIELKELGLIVEDEVRLPIEYRGRKICSEGFRIDLVVQDQVLVELKSVEAIRPVHQKQLLTYLRLANKRIGLLINFNVCMLRDGISRILNPYFRDG